MVYMWNVAPFFFKNILSDWQEQGNVLEQRAEGYK